MEWILVTAAAVLVVTAAVWLAGRHYEKRLSAYQNKLLKKQIEEVHGIYQTMRGWRHDYHNHLQVLKAKLALDQTEAAKAYLDELEQDLSQIRQLSETGNVDLDAILNSKLSLAASRGIRLHFKAQKPEGELPVSSIDLCVLLGNLIDNAVEACDSVEEEKRFLRLYIGVFKKQFYISVSNATSELVRKPDHEYVTRKRGNHGYGLLRVDKVVNKYNGYISRKNEPGIFVTEIMLPLYEGERQADRSLK